AVSPTTMTSDPSLCSRYEPGAKDSPATVDGVVAVVGTGPEGAIVLVVAAAVVAVVRLAVVGTTIVAVFGSAVVAFAPLGSVTVEAGSLATSVVLVRSMTFPSTWA